MDKKHHGVINYLEDHAMEIRCSATLDIIIWRLDFINEKIEVDSEEAKAMSLEIVKNIRNSWSNIINSETNCQKMKKYYFRKLWSPSTLTNRRKH